MALFKAIRQDNGITLSYHRVLYVKVTTNRQNSIAVVSYVDEAAREDEKVGLTQPYSTAVTYETAFDEEMTISTAYDYLKTLPEFKNSADV